MNGPGLVRGARVGPYEIVSIMGRGGMGDVYRAKDLRLSRDVALKVLHREFAADVEREAGEPLSHEGRSHQDPGYPTASPTPTATPEGSATST